MAYQQMPGSGLWVPSILPIGGNASSLTLTAGGVLDAENEKYAMAFAAPKTGNIKAIGFKIEAFTQCTNGLTVALQHPAAAAVGPDGSDHSTGTCSPVGTGWQTVTLGSVQAVTRAESLYAVIRFTTWAASNNVSIAAITSPGVTRSWPCPCHYTGSSWADKNWGQILGVQYDDDVWYPLFDAYALPFITFASDRYFESSTPNEIGIIVRFAAKVKVVGAWLYGGQSSSAYSCAFRLYDDASTLMATSTVLSDYHRYNSVGYLSCVPFDTEVEIPANTSYRLAGKAITNGAVDLAKASVSSAAILNAWAGTAWVKTTRKDAGAWTDQTTDTYLMGLIVSQIDDGAGGAGGGPMPFRMVDSRGNRRRRGY